jgi:hypothetical protein
VDPHSVDSIREGIERVIADRAYREQLVENGFKNVQRFSPMLVAREYARLYGEIGGRRILSPAAEAEHPGARF